MNYEQIYTSIACNRFPACLDLNENLEIVFGANNAIAISDLKYKKIETFVKHKSSVLTVKWVRNQSNRICVSGSNDNNAIFWDLSDCDNISSTVLDGHTGPITSIEAAFIENVYWIGTSSADNTLKIWNGKIDNLKCIQTISLGSKFSYDMKFIAVNDLDQPLLVMSIGEDLQIMAMNNNEFQKVLFLKSGHEDWIRSIDVLEVNNDLMILTGAQDNYARIWKLTFKTNSQLKQNKLDVLNIKEGLIEMEQQVIFINENISFFVNLESVLAGHEGWVYSVQFFKNLDNKIGIMTCSIDKSIIIWYQEENGLWMDTHRIGEMGGGNLGFLGGKISKNGSTLISQGFQGSFHTWYIKRISENDNIEQEITFSGHFREVKDIAWSPQGEFLFSVSADQTTRVHAPWMENDKIRWNEMGRVQIHGYDLTSIAVISKYKIATGAEEKVVRILSTTEDFIKKYCLSETNDEFLRSLPKGASIPSLGLSNKAVFNNTREETYESNKIYKQNRPPFEEDLMQNTLWPEVNKFYGHGFEIFALDASSDGKLLASSCRATSSQHAEIIIWDIETAKEIQRLKGHNLTVTDLKFSPDNNYLLSTSRDRTWCLFKKSDPNKMHFDLDVKPDKKAVFHTRIIWSCDWTFDSKLFATCSRDGTIAIWIKDGDEIDILKGWRLFGKTELKNESITSISFLKKFYRNNKNEYLLAAGLESGKIVIFKITNTLENVYFLNTDQGHHLAVRKLRWCPRSDVMYLASAGEDGLVRIHNFI